MVNPRAIDGSTGVTASDTSSAAVTVRVTPGLVILPEVAVMVVVPAATEVARPVFNPIVATPVLVLAQVTLSVIFAVPPV